MSPGHDSVSIVYVTHRRAPRFDWFVDSLSRQILPGDELEVIFVDAHCSPTRRRTIERLVGDRFGWRHVAPKPSPYAGPYRRTRRELFAASNARNTGIVYARHKYVAFVDDCSLLMPGWLQEVRRAARLRYVVTGAYQKHHRMEVREGVLVASEARPEGVDARWNMGEESPLVPVSGQHFYTMTCGVPRRVLVALNGFDELCDGFAGEDYHLGLRLEWFDMPIYYSRAMLAIESEELHRQRSRSSWRVGRTLSRSRYMRRLADFGVSARYHDGAYDGTHMLLDILFGTRQQRSLGNSFELATLRPDDFPALPGSFPDRLWFDGSPLADL